MGPKSLKIVLIITLLLPVVLGKAALASMGSSANYTLEAADLTGVGTTGSSASYTMTGITDENFEASSDSYNLCGGLPEELYGNCIAAVTPAPPPDDDDGGWIAGGREDPPPSGDEDQLPPEEDEDLDEAAEEPEITPEDLVGPQLVTFPTNDFGDGPPGVLPPGFTPPSPPSAIPVIDQTPPEPPAEPAAPQEPSEPKEEPESVEVPPEELTDSTAEDATDAIDRDAQIPGDEIKPGLYPSAERLPGQQTYTKIQEEAGKLAVDAQPAATPATQWSGLCLCCLILLFLLLFVIFSELFMWNYCLDKKTRKRIKEDLGLCFKKSNRKSLKRSKKGTKTRKPGQRK